MLFFNASYMKTRDDNPSTANAATGGGSAGDNELTGLPGLRTWRGVYVVVLASFVFWVGLLFALSVGFS